jgi:hypothetical protein
MFVPINPVKASFGVFDGHRSKYFEAKTKISHSITSHFHAAWFHDAATACKDALLKLFESKKGKDRESFSAKFESHAARIWEKAMEDAKISGAFIRASSQYLVHCMGTSWAEWEKCGFTSSEEHLGAVADARIEYAILINREFLEQFKKCIFPKGTDAQGTTYTDSLRPLVLSPVNIALIGGTHTFAGVLDDIWKMPALQTWALFMFRYEGVADIQMMNLAYEIRDLLQLTTGLENKSIHQMDQLAQQIMEPQVKTWTDFASFIRYFRASLKYDMIRNLSQLDSENSFAWEMAYNHLTTSRHENQTLTLDATDAAIKLAEDQIILADQKKLALSTPKYAASSAKVKDPAMIELEKKVEKLSALLANKNDSGGGRGGGSRGGGRGGSRGRGRGGGARGGKATGTYSFPLCTNCDRHHAGGAAKCIKGRDLASEIKELENLASIQKRMSERTQAAKASAAAAAIEEINEDRDEYSTSHYPLTMHVWNPDDAHEVAHVMSTSTILDVTSLKGACVDSAAQVHITPEDTYVIKLLTGKTVRLGGINSTYSLATEADLGFPTVTRSGKPIILHSMGRGLKAPNATESLLSLAQLLKNGFKVYFSQGTKDDPQYGGYIITPSGEYIDLLFKDNLWRLPLWTASKQAAV